MRKVSDIAGAAHLLLAEGVVHLDPEAAVFAAMLQGWAAQQHARFLNPDGTIKRREQLVRRFAVFTGLYPWQWQVAEVDAFFTMLRCRGDRPIAVSTGRNYEDALRLFLEYVTDLRYGWPAACESRFGQVPAQLLHERNTVRHRSEYEGDARRRPLTYDELQALFDAADARVAEIRARHRKGSLAAMRDGAMLKCVYAFGLRRCEARGMEVNDLRHNPKAPHFGRFGALAVRFGKASGGGPPRRRTVLTVPEMDWVVGVLEQYVDEIRPTFAPVGHPALWITERGHRISARGIDEAFVAARRAAGLPGELDLHCLRHTYITHLVEFDYPQRFVQEQVGHAYASTTALYTGVSDEYRTRLLRQALAKHPELWEEERR